MNKKREIITQGNKVSEIATYSLGGHRQKVLFEGKKETNPVVIYLHGGPGAPIPFCVGSRGLFPEFTDKFIMVYWDQLGSGINNYRIDENFKIDNYINMTIDLVTEVKKKFSENQIVLFGASWGSVLAAKTVAKVPHLVDKVFIYGQVLKELALNEETLETLQNSKLPQAIKGQLILIQQKEQKTKEDLKKVMGWVQKYTEGYFSKTGQKMPFGKLLLGILRSPDYTFKDARAVMMSNGSMKNNSIILELLDIDLTEELMNMQVPYRILQGDTDIVTSSKMINNFVELSKNPNLSIKMVEKSGHIPSVEGMQQIINEADLFIN